MADTPKASGHLSTDEVKALILLAEYEDRARRRLTRRRRLKKAGLIALVPLAGPLVGDLWAENDSRGWR